MGWHLRYRNCTSKYSHLGTCPYCPRSLKPGSILKERATQPAPWGTLSPGEVLMLPQGTEDWKLKPCAHAFGVLLAPECASCHCSQM